MFVSLNGSLTRGVSGPDKVRLAAKLGYGGVDWDLGPAKTAGLEATKALFTELKIKPTITSLPMARPLPFAGENAAFQEGLKDAGRRCRVRAGCGLQEDDAGAVGDGATTKEEYRKVVSIGCRPSRRCCRSQPAARARVPRPLYMRQGAGRDGQPRVPFIWTLPETVALAKDCGPNMGAVLDVWHWHHSGGTVEDILAAGKTASCTSTSPTRSRRPAEEVRDNQRFMPGEGSIDLVGFLQALKKTG